jgi:amino acid adenylation domain-containing protein
VHRFLDCYQQLIESAVAEPDTPLAWLRMLPAAEETTVVERWNDTTRDLPYEQGLHQLFEHQATIQPDAVAVVAGGQGHTFAEVDRRANQLAHHLVALGVAPGSIVAVQLPLGIDYVVSVLATLKAGGAYLPVDPEYPTARIEFVLQDSGADVVITPEVPGLVADRPVTPVRSGFVPGNPCYVIYTSGSTGTPKAVVVRHRGAVNNLCDLNTRYGVGPGDSVLALSSTSFDMSVYELLGVTGAGGTVILPEPELLRDPAHWAELLVDHGVTVWNSAPAILELLLDHLEQSIDGQPDTLRVALLGGDWIPVSMPDRLRALAPGVRFVSLGGATEASIHSIVYEVDAVDPQWTAIPYGTPLANQQAFILDDTLQPVPIGVPGELFLGGVGLAAGYLERPELTAEKFLPWRGRTVYRTGDLARWRTDGVIELLGRKDFMVKINGVRIELGEVESALRGHPGIADAVALARTDDLGDRQLVGFVVGHGSVDTDELRAFVEDRLPSAMVPAQLVVLDAFPLNPNGKVDRRALADAAARRTVVVSEPPRGPLEEQIAQAWQRILGLPECNRTDDFFALGGDSFKAVRLARAMGVRLPVVEVFRNPTIAALAEHLATGVVEHGLLQRLTPERPTASVGLVCVPYGGGNAIAYQPLADRLGEHFSLWSLDLPGHDLSDPSDLEPVPDVVTRCAEQIRDSVDKPVALYGQCAGTAATIELARRLEEIGVPVLGVFLGAAMPDNDPQRSWRMVVDGTESQLFDHMRRLGGFDGALSDDDVNDILRVVRHDLAEAVRFYLREQDNPGRPLSCPVHSVVGDDDPATEGYTGRYRDWERYGCGVSLSVVHGGGHYFSKHQPGAVADIVTRRLFGATALGTVFESWED